LLGIELFALAAEELGLQLFELPLGILPAAAFIEMPAAFLLQLSLALLNQLFPRPQRALERRDFG